MAPGPSPTPETRSYRDSESVLGRCRHGIGKALTIHQLGQNGSSWHPLVNALDSIVIIVRSDKDNGCVADFSKPPRSLYAFATPFEINVHQNNVGFIAHSEGAGLPRVRSKTANVETQRVHFCFQVERDQDLILDDKGTPAGRRRALGHVYVYFLAVPSLR